MRRRPGRERQGRPADGRGRQRAAGSSWTARPGNDPRRDRAARCADSCSSILPLCRGTGSRRAGGRGRSTVDRHRRAHQPSRVATSQQSCEYVVPSAGVVTAIAAVAIPQGLPRTELDRAMTPGQPTAEPVDDPLDAPTVIGERPTRHAVRRGQQRHEPGPPGISQDCSTQRLPIIDSSSPDQAGQVSR